MLPHSKGPLLIAVIVFAIQVVIVEVGCSRIIVAGRQTTRERLPRFVAIAGARRVERPHFVHAEGRVFARLTARPLARLCEFLNSVSQLLGHLLLPASRRAFSTSLTDGQVSFAESIGMQDFKDLHFRGG